MTTRRDIEIIEAERPEEDTAEVFHLLVADQLRDAYRRARYLNGEFVECDACFRKPGSPELCAGCLANRTTIGDYREKK